MNGENPDTSIASRRAFEDCIRTGFEEVADTGCRELFVADSDFARWPLGDRLVVGHLTRWAESHRRVTVLAEHFDAMARLHPRWVEWRRQWAHVVQCRANTELEAGRMPTLFIAPGRFSIRLFDSRRFLGRRSRAMADVLQDRQLFDAVSQQSVPAFPGTVVGL